MKERAHVFKKTLSTIVASAMFAAGLIALPLTSATAMVSESTQGSNQEHTPLNAKTAHDISTGRIRLENNQIDSLLYHKTELNPNADNDGDGLKNSEELYTYEKNGRTYYGYNSHPLIKDTDGDGLEDKTDNNPRRWDISPRDMALFMELVYREDSYVKEVLDYSKPLRIIYENRNEYRLMHNELAPFWKVKETYHFGSGFDAILFENVNPAYPFIEQNGVQVLAIRGTKGATDVWNDVLLGTGSNPGQAADIDKLIDEYKQKNTVSNLYVTGHSLGGYLAQRALIRAKSSGATFNIKAYTFNAPRIKGNIFNKWLWETSDFGDKLTEEGYAVHYKVDNDTVIGGIGNFKGAISIGSSKAGHGSRSYFEPRMNDFQGFTVGERNKIEGPGRKIDALDGLVNEPVIKTDEQAFEPKITNIDIMENDPLPKGTTLKHLLNPNDIPQGSTITDITEYDKIDTSKYGKYEGKILLVLEGNKFKDIIVPITIHKRLVNLEEIPNVTAVKDKKVEVKKDATIPENFDFTPYLKDLPENSTVQVAEQPDTKKTGEATFKVEVTFASGAKKKITLKARVIELIPGTPLTPAKRSIPWTQLTPAKRSIPWTQLTPAKKSIPWTQLTPAKKSIPWTQLTPAKKSIKWMELTPAKPVSPTPTPTPTPNPPAPKPMPESVLPEPTPEPIPDDQEQPEKIPVAPASTAKLDSTLNNTLQVGVKNIAYAGKSNKITVIASAKSEFLNELRQKQQVKAYAYIYSDPKLLYSTDGTKHVTVRIDENGTITFNAIVPDEYEGNHTILLIDEQGNQVAWTNVLVKKDEPSQTQDTQDSDENKPNTNENTNTNVHTSESATEKPRVSEHPNSSNTPKEIANPKELETPKELALPKAKPVETEKPNKTSNNTIARTGIQTIPMAICALLMLIAASATFFARQLKK